MVENVIILTEDIMKEHAAAKLGYELNATYLDYYWRDQHKIIDAGFDQFGHPWVTSLWGKTQTKTTHATPRDKRDRKI